MGPAQNNTETIHASCVAVGRTAVLILGKPGSGKSALALKLIALGASLVADDRTCLRSDKNDLRATCPSAIQGKIEARGVGILAADTVNEAVVRLVVDLNETENERLPQERRITLLGHNIRLLHQPRGTHFSASVHLMLKNG